MLVFDNEYNQSPCSFQSARRFWDTVFPEHLVIAIDFEMVSNGTNRPPLAVGVYGGTSYVSYWMQADGPLQNWHEAPFRIHPHNPSQYEVKVQMWEAQPPQYTVQEAAYNLLHHLKNELNNAGKQKIIFLHHGILDPTVLLNWFTHCNLVMDIRALIHGYIDTFTFASIMFPNWPRVQGKFHGAISFISHSLGWNRVLNFSAHNPVDDAEVLYRCLPFSSYCDQGHHPNCVREAGLPMNENSVLKKFVTPEKDQYFKSVDNIENIAERAQFPYKDWTDLADLGAGINDLNYTVIIIQSWNTDIQRNLVIIREILISRKIFIVGEVSFRDNNFKVPVRTQDSDRTVQLFHERGMFVRKRSSLRIFTPNGDPVTP